ncbi:nuclear envelope protein Cut8 [Rhizodiscina lignyota]|uniref:Tethering factor for nuclear proteasome STS1 n=1 Tax=Rhizodiscina lignyota TaxID=1504668 RepID=A0A9P4MAS2_9PEZI|nr:nuclear envelope protein Cut8 [Rhizodiscina lignyota]
MTSILATPSHFRRSPTRSLGVFNTPSPSMTGSRKRKADDEGDNDMRMSASPLSSPSIPNQSLPTHHSSSSRTPKRLRTNLIGRPLSVPRLLETLDLAETRTLLRQIVERHPEMTQSVVSLAPRPSVSSVVSILHNYEAELRKAFPFGGSQSSDYAYNRVRQPLMQLLDALKDYTPHFLPPNEPQTSTSLNYLDHATEVIHRLPEWDSFAHSRHKAEAYEEVAKAWAVVVREAAKRGGGIQLLNGGWDQKIARHNEMSGGKMEDAVNELKSSLGWMSGGGFPGQLGAGQGDGMSIRQQLLNGTYGLGSSPVRVGPW